MESWFRLIPHLHLAWIRIIGVYHHKGGFDIVGTGFTMSTLEMALKFFLSNCKGSQKVHCCTEPHVQID